ncbi:unannotated protein [freshwater metagenome]|uniref:Unannotated protein n=1 Tax=freshwater metagenome TaxID=449393 RepID=A0A6J7E853_9ZZZZ|nr:hypothetical protein [Actinomycetota bacterium]
MKWLAGCVVLVAIAAFGVAIYVVLDNRDPVPGDIAACTRREGLSAVRSRDGLAAMREDVLAGTVTVTRRWDWGKTKGALLGGPRDDYAVLVLWNVGTPSLAAARSARRVYERPADFPLVVIESESRALIACAQSA